MAADAATTLVDIRFTAPMNRQQIDALEQATGMRIRGVHDADRRLVGTGFIGGGGGPVMLALTREAAGQYRITALTHDAHACDPDALTRWRARVADALTAMAAPWSEPPR